MQKGLTPEGAFHRVPGRQARGTKGASTRPHGPMANGGSQRPLRKSGPAGPTRVTSGRSRSLVSDHQPFSARRTDDALVRPPGGGEISRKAPNQGLDRRAIRAWQTSRALRARKATAKTAWRDLCGYHQWKPRGCPQSAIDDPPKPAFLTARTGMRL